jgi:predicted PurR-regulated permease PerM
MAAMSEEDDAATQLEADLESEEATQEVLDDIHAHAAEQAGVSPDTEFGTVGLPVNRRAPLYIGFIGTLGAACALGIVWAIVTAGQVLVLLGLAFFIAVGLDPAVVWLYRRGLPRPAAVGVVLALLLGVFVGFTALAIPVVSTQATTLAEELPHYLHTLNNHSTALGKLNAKYHFVSGLQKLLNGSTSFNSALGVGKVLVGFITSALLVMIVTVYLLADLPHVRRGIYLLAPKSRRARMVLLTDEILDRVGGYVLGNLFTSLIAGLGTGLWALILGIPYALLLGVLVALLALVPIVGATIGGILVVLVGLTVSPSVAIATAIFYLAFFTLLEYVLTPRIMARTVSVPSLVTVLATILGGALLGIVGALVAIPVAAAIKLLHDEITVQRLGEN